MLIAGLAFREVVRASGPASRSCRSRRWSRGSRDRAHARRRLGLFDRIGIGFGFDREAVIGVQPEADLDDVFAHGSSPAIFASGAPARIASALAIAASARSCQNGASGVRAKTFRMPSRVS